MFLNLTLCCIVLLMVQRLTRHDTLLRFYAHILDTQQRGLYFELGQIKHKGKHSGTAKSAPGQIRFLICCTTKVKLFLPWSLTHVPGEFWRDQFFTYLILLLTNKHRKKTWTCLKLCSVKRVSQLFYIIVVFWFDYKYNASHHNYHYYYCYRRPMLVFPKIKTYVYPKTKTKQLIN